MRTISAPYPVVLGDEPRLYLVAPFLTKRHSTSVSQKTTTSKELSPVLSKKTNKTKQTKYPQSFPKSQPVARFCQPRAQQLHAISPSSTSHTYHKTHALFLKSRLPGWLPTPVDSYWQCQGKQDSAQCPYYLSGFSKPINTDPEEPINRPTYRAAPQVLKGGVETLIVTLLQSWQKTLEKFPEPKIHLLLFSFSCQELECTCILTLPAEVLKEDQILLMDEPLP